MNKEVRYDEFAVYANSAVKHLGKAIKVCRPIAKELGLTLEEELRVWHTVLEVTAVGGGNFREEYEKRQ